MQAQAEKQEEQVLAIPTSYMMEAIGKPQFGLIHVTPLDYIAKIFHPQQLKLIPRSSADKDENYKQIIPYAMLVSTDHGGLPIVFRYARAKKGGETRLHSKLSIGVGGHINDTDWAEELVSALEGNKTALPYQCSLLREVAEETTFCTDLEHSEWPVGIIYDDTNSVGRVHVGILHIIRVKNYEAVKGASEEIGNSEWVKASELTKTSSHDYEGWSQIVIRHIFAGNIVF